MAGNFQSLQHIGRVSTCTNGECHVLWLDQVFQLFGENVFVVRIIGPSRHHRDAVGQSDGPKTLGAIASHGYALAQVAGKVRGQGCATPIAEEEYPTILLVGMEENVTDLI